ncbi:MAG: hypothetical protein COC02_08645, partial [Rhodospirillaceae bacterium]
MRGVKFECRKRELFYVISNGITKNSWKDTYTPQNMEVIKTIRKYGGADSATILFALDSIPDSRDRASLLQLVWSMVIFEAPISIEFESAREKSSQGIWRNNKPAEWYVPEISQIFDIVSINNNKI